MKPGIILLTLKIPILEITHKLLSVEFEQLGYNPTLIYIDERGAALKKIKDFVRENKVLFFISHNLKGQDLIINGRTVFDHYHIPLLTVIDTPLNKYNFLKKTRNIIYCCADASFADLMMKITKKKIYTIHAGAMTNSSIFPTSFNDKHYDLLFLGRISANRYSYRDYSFIENLLKIILVRRAFVPCEKQIHEFAIEAFTKLKEKKLYNKEFISDQFLTYCWRLAHAVRANRRKYILRELFKLPERYKQCFITDSPEYIRKKCSSTQNTILPFQPWPKVVEYIQQSKIVINIQPFHIDGSHERLCTAMACGSVVVSDANPYLEEKFSHGKDIIFYNFEKGILRTMLEYYLERPDLLEAIAHNGFKKIKKFGMPKHMAKKMLEIYYNYNQYPSGKSERG